MKLLLEDDEVDGIKILDDTNDQKQNLSYLEEVSEFMKLNYRCKKGTVEADSFSCGNTPEERKKNYDKQQKGQGKLPANKSTSSESITTLQSKLKSLEKDSLQHITKIHELDGTTIDVESEIKRIKGQLEKIGNNLDSKSVKLVQNPIVANKIDPLVTKTKTIIEKVKKEKASGKVSEKTKQDLKKSIEELKVTSTSVVQKDKTQSTKSTSSFMKTEEYKTMMTNTNKLLEQPDYKKAAETYIRDSSSLNEPLIKYHNIINKNKATNQIISDTEGNISRKSIEAIFKMDELLDNSRTKEDITVHSGISKALYDKLNGNDSEFQTPCFISTSANKKVAEGFAEYRNSKSGNSEGFMLEIRLAKGSSAIATNDFIQKTKPFGKDAEYVVGENGKFFTGGSQHEIILGRNTTYKVVEKRDDTTTSKKGKYKIPIHVLVVEAYIK
jgi:hypothetical protein